MPLNDPRFVALTAQGGNKKETDTSLSRAVQFAESHIARDWLFYKGGKLLPADENARAQFTEEQILEGTFTLNSRSAAAIMDLQKCTSTLDGKESKRVIRVRFSNGMIGYLGFDGHNYVLAGIPEIAESQTVPVRTCRECGEEFLLAENQGYGKIEDSMGERVSPPEFLLPEHDHNGKFCSGSHREPKPVKGDPMSSGCCGLNLERQ